jgi:hypothetical protein
MSSGETRLQGPKTQQIGFASHLVHAPRPCSRDLESPIGNPQSPIPNRGPRPLKLAVFSVAGPSGDPVTARNAATKQSRPRRATAQTLPPDKGSPRFVATGTTEDGQMRYAEWSLQNSRAGCTVRACTLRLWGSLRRSRKRVRQCQTDDEKPLIACHMQTKTGNWCQKPGMRYNLQ